MIIVQLEQGTEAWKDWRKNGLPASETPALFGENEYFTKREVWLAHKGLIPEWFIAQDDKSYIFDKGHSFEEKMRAEYFSITGEQFEPLCIQDEEFPFIIASLDGGIIRNGKLIKIFEAKLIPKEVKEAIAREGVKAIPRKHWIQMQQQLKIAKDAECCVYFGHDLNDTAVIVEVYPDPLFHMELVTVLLEFKQSLDLNLEPPMTKDDFHFSERDAEFEELAIINNERSRLKKMYEEIDAKYKAKMAEIMKLEPHTNVASIKHAVKIKTMCKYYVKYESIPEIQALSKDYIEKFKVPSESYLQAWFPKQKVTA